MDKHPKIITTKEVAAYLNCDTPTIYRLLRQNQLPVFKVGSHYRFDIDALKSWSRQRRCPLCRSPIRSGFDGSDGKQFDNCPIRSGRVRKLGKRKVG
jgi:excisionase family DNA binding protein